MLFGTLLVREQCRVTSMNPAERNWLAAQTSFWGSHFIFDYCLYLLKAIAIPMVDISLSPCSSDERNLVLPSIY